MMLTQCLRRAKLSLALIIASQLIYSVPIYAADARITISKACRVELTGESTRRWNEISGMSPTDRLPAIIRELENAERRGDTTFTTQTLDFALKAIATQVQSLTYKDNPKLPTILDQIVVLAKPLPSGYSLGKTHILTESAIAYGKIGHFTIGQQTLQLAAESVSGIRNTPKDLVAAHIRLAEGWIALDQPAEAASSLNYGFEQTIKNLKDPYAKREFLSQIVNLYLQIYQPTKALEVLKQLSPEDYDPDITITQIAATYFKARDPVKAKQLLDPLLKAALAIKDVEQREIKLMTLVLHYAPSGDLRRSQQIVSLMKRPNSFRARSWLTIAAEGRKFNQPEIRESALARLVADAKAAKIDDQFGGRFDNEWYGEMSNLSQTRAYQPELKALIAKLRAVNVLAIVLRDLIANKQFTTARQMVPRPMIVQIDAGYFDETDRWLDNIAIAALEAGQTKDAEARIAGEKTDVRRLLRFAQAFHRRGNRSLADQLFTRSQVIANSISALPTAITTHAAIANALISTNRPADKVLNRIVTLIQTEKASPQQAQLLLSISAEFNATRSAYFTLAERLKLLQQVDFAALAGNQAIANRQPEEASRFIGYAGRNPSEKFDFALRVVELNLTQGNFTKARSLLNIPIQTLRNGSESSLPPIAERSRFWGRIALNLVHTGDTKTAIAIAQNVTPSPEREQLLQRLRCYQD
ncbi:hypothetical protein ACN23B_27900 (plasmid) [Anabaena sp. FACHB-709]|uniref:Uncharacterized protein n=2 Tax=Nostocaceae TaxID=1162 RepID=A0A1Z4KUD1_ANAVA|nr:MULTISPECIES: hypothetical protein [Nostocaceae]BAY72640.1 hypothetical protein NIES23_54680 [Trichormus variabilis NIES-23]MBD2174222.1 hypothetical protein [Anabaena cylindrica FACHB-318]MBD2266010.1 hypothetical protein [Anabaena sp. FACHB-709]MBD2275457.1 hypothetical protein [Nostoc sp. PCC 7120 = FACHB-418]MBD2286282.1 hypothetical protein [Anabaena cylindrica FACHB-170]